MKKIFLTLISTIIVFGCSKNEENKNLSSEKENEIIAKHFGASSLKENQKIPIFDSLRDKENLKEEGYEIVMDKEVNKIVYAIPFKDDDRKFLLTDSSGKEVILDINVDEKGNGDVTLISGNNKTIKFFENAQLTKFNDFERVNISLASNSSKFLNENNEEWKLISRPPNKFRSCFDQAYNDICDGFWGCVAWHTHPAIPIMAALMCSF